MDLGTSARQRLLAAIGVGYVALVWLEALIYGPVSNRPVEASDGVLMVALGLAIPELIGAWRWWLRSPFALVPTAIGATLVISTVAHGDGLPWGPALRHAAQLAIIAVFATIASGDQWPRAGTWLGRLACAFVVVTALGWLLGVAGLLEWLEPILHRPAFVELAPHPTLGDAPRLLGGFSFSAEACGSFAIAAFAVLLAHRARGLRDGFVIGAGLLAVATLSISAASAIVALPVVVFWMHRGRLGRVASIAVATVGLLAIQPSVHRGPVVVVDAAVSCDASFPNHWLRTVDAEGACELVRYRDGHVVTRYGEAKLDSVQMFLASPLIGQGARAFRDHASQPDDSGLRLWNPYYTPHGAHGVAAEQGVVGLLLYGLLIAAIGRALVPLWRAKRPEALALAVFFAACMGGAVSLDLHKLRLLWVAIGIVAGLTRAGTRRT